MKHSAEFYNGRWERGNIPVKLRGLRLAEYEPVHGSGRIAKLEAEAFVREFKDHYISPVRAASGQLPKDRSTVGRGLLMYGYNGTRKTTLAAAIATEVQYLPAAYKSYYIRFSDWKRALTDTFSKESTERISDARLILKRVEEYPLVVIDDIGQEHRTQSGFTESSLHELLRVRYEAARPTIVTTNIDPIEMRDTYGKSFDSFRNDAFVTLEMIGPDSRKPKGN